MGTSNSAGGRTSGRIPEAADKALEQWVFGRFRFDRRSEELFRDGERVELQPKPATVLGLLLERRGDLVGRDQIRARVWGDTILDYEQRIHSAVRDIRRALGDDASAPRYVETVPTKGYRFIAPVSSGVSSGNARRAPAALRVAAISVFLLAAAMTTAWIYGRPGSEPAGSAEPTKPADRSLLLVRPVEPIGEDPQHLAEGLWEELLVATAHIAPDSLGVIARTTARKLDGDAEMADGELETGAVRYVLDTTLRRDGPRVRISASLTAPPGPEQLWASIYEREVGDLLAVQADIADNIARALRMELVGGPRLPQAPASVPEAYSAYLTGRHLLAIGTPDALERGVESFESSIASDDRFALAHAGLARALLALGGSDDRARMALDRSLQLEPELGEAHFLRGRLSLYDDWDWPSAAAAFESAIAAEPGSAEFRLGYAEYLVSAGAYAEAVAQATMARTLDPLSGGVRGRLGWLYLRAREPTRAVQECLRAKDVAPESFYEDLIAHDCLVLGFRQLGDSGRAVENARGVMALFGAVPDEARELATDAEILDRYFRWRIAAMQQFPGTTLDVAISQVAIGEIDDALATLEIALDQRSPGLVFLSTDPSFDDLRDHPGFAGIVRRVGNPFDPTISRRGVDDASKAVGIGGFRSRKNRYAAPIMV